MSTKPDSVNDPADPIQIPKKKVTSWKTVTGLWVSAAVIGLGLALLAFAAIRFFTVERGIGLVIPGATLIVAGLTALMAQLGIESWAEQKRKDHSNAEYRHREGIYVRLAKLMVSQLGDGYEVKEDHSLRAEIAVWGSAGVVTTQAEWQSFIAGLPLKNGGADLSGENSVRAKKLLANSILAMRADLESDLDDPPTQRNIRRSIFNEKNEGSIE